MSEAATLERPQTRPAEQVDVLIVGAGISGVGGAYHLKTQRPGTSFVVLESQETFGGTWWTHKYPGIRSDSDLHTFGYRFKPWTGTPIATADEIRKYMGDVIEENGLDRHIRYNHKISSAHWSSAENRWTIEATRTDTGEAVGDHRQLPLDVPGLLPTCGGLHAGMGRAWTASRARSSTRRPGRRGWTTRASGSSSSAPAPRPPPSCRTWPTRPRM